MFLLLFISSKITAQNCQVNGPIPINSQGITEITFEVSGLLDDDLSGTQSLCLVELGFSHNSVSTMEMNITSPAGQSIQLIGAANANPLGSTQFISWDVTFASSNYPAAPDDGFGEAWDNANDWQAFETYDGRYRPFQGNLEDMNMGSANGIWTIEMEDLSQFGNGVLDFIKIQFCDANGQACNVCYADAGFFDQVPSQVFCANDPLLSDESYFNVIGEGASFNQDLYNFAVADGDNILSFGSNLDLSTFAVGNYTICGVINNQADQPALEVFTSLADLNSVFNDGTYCGAVMRNCMQIRIEEPNSQTTETETICPGEVITINGLNFYESIDTTVYTYTAGGCDAATRYIIDQLELESVIIASANTIDCNSTLLLNGNSSEGSNLTYTWTTESGSFVNNAGPIATIDEPGLYFLEVSNGNCSDLTSFQVEPGNNYANTIELAADSLGCANSVVTINTTITGNYDSFTWSGPGITNPNELNPNVSEAGVYTITVQTAGSACSSASNSIVIAQSDSAATPLFNNIAPLDCNEITQLQVVNQLDVQSAAWINESGDTLSQNPVAFNVPSPGDYTYAYIDGFGCAGMATTTVEANFDELEYEITIDSLTCGKFDGQIFVNVTSGIVDSYFWVGPDSQFSTNPNPEVELPGNYQLAMTGVDGCITRDTVIMDYDSDAFNFAVSVDKITCAQTDIDIFVVPAPTNFTYEWERKNDALFTAPDESRITVDGGGVYYVTITRPSDGCQTLEATNILTDTVPADLTFDLEKIDCDTDEIALESNANGFGLESFTWSGPGITPANESEVFPIVDMIGEYVIEGISGNGCEFMDTIIVEDDFTPINITPLQTVILDCFDQDKTAIIEADREGDFTWVSPTGIEGGPLTDNRLILDIDEVGDYTVDVIGTNGCNDQLTLEVVYGQAPPEVDLVGPLALDCLNPEATIDATLVDVDDFVWTHDGNTTDQSITVTDPGEYILEVSNNAGCASSDTLMIEDNRRVVDLTLAADSITCVNVQTQIEVETMEMGAIAYQWEGSNGDLGTDPILTVNEIDTYTVTITAADGCTGTETITIESDTISPQFGLLGIVEITCQEDAIGVIDPTSPNFDVLQADWILDGNIEASGLSVDLTTGGMYTVVVTGENGCTSETMVEVLEDKVFPEVNIEPDSINCIESVFEVEAEIIVGNNPSFEWDGPDDDVVGSTDAIISGVEAGIYTVTVTDDNNCSIIETVEIDGDLEQEFTNADNLFLTCDNPEAAAVLVAFDPAVNTVVIQDENGQALADYTDLISEPGEYTVLTTGANGCVGETVFNVFGDLAVPEATIDSTNINCTNTEGILVVESDDNIDSYEWISVNGALPESSETLTTPEAGYYEVVVTGLNGCVDTLSTNIEIDTISPVLDLEQVGLIGCESQEATISAIANEDNPLSYDWSSTDGTLLNGEGLPDLLVGSPGTYTVTVTNQVNECMTEASYEVGDSSAVISIVEINEMAPPCEGQDMGEIFISAIDGGFAPLSYSIDGGATFSNDALFDELPAGPYQVIVSDSIGCTATQEVTLVDGQSIDLDLGVDSTIALGTNYTFDIMSNYDPSDLTLEWSTNYPDYECDGCWNHEETPLNTTIYTLTITDEFNCTTTDEIIIRVIDTVQVFIPNIVDTESVNEDAMVMFNAGPGVQTVNSWTILDRWGNVMHNQKDFAPNDIANAWDGTNNGVKVVPGVYLYITEVVLINGDIRTKAGDITVIR